jgi:hypothetical protein
MSQGKYSPAISSKDANRPYEAYCYNADRQIPPEWALEMKERGEIYDTRIHFANYDENGYDNYGYSAFNADGKYVGISMNGVDRLGYTEMDYLTMSEDDFNNVL